MYTINRYSDRLDLNHEEDSSGNQNIDSVVSNPINTEHFAQMESNNTNNKIADSKEKPVKSTLESLGYCFEVGV